MKITIGLALLIFAGFAGWRIGGDISSDAVSMGVGVLFGIVAGIPTALLVMANNRKREVANGSAGGAGKNHTYQHVAPAVQQRKAPSRRNNALPQAYPQQSYPQQSYPQQDYQQDYQQQPPVILLAGQPQMQLPGYPSNYAQSYPQSTHAYPQGYPQNAQQPANMIDGQAQYGQQTGYEGYQQQEMPKERTYRIVGESEEWLQ